MRRVGLSGFRIVRDGAGHKRRGGKNAKGLTSGGMLQRKLAQSFGVRVVVAARLQDGEDHQVRVRKEPFLGFRSGDFGRVDDRAKVLVACKTAQMVGANAGEGTTSSSVKIF